MNDVDLDNLSKNGVQNIFLHSSAVDIFGEKKCQLMGKKKLMQMILKFIFGFSAFIMELG